MRVLELIALAEPFDGALDTPCLILPHKPERTGYVRVAINGSREFAHRAVYAEMVAPVPIEMEVDHLCRWRACMNWTHLESVTPRENVRRSDSPMGRNARKTHCPQLHKLAGDNLRLYPDGRRGCRTCQRAQWRAWRARRGHLYGR